LVLEFDGDQGFDSLSNWVLIKDLIFFLNLLLIKDWTFLEFIADQGFAFFLFEFAADQE
jgi:hypothetical protein